MSVPTYVKKAMRFLNQNSSTFLFGIPLIGSYLTDDFEGACKLLGQTLESCLRQTDDNFEIYVACNEIPDGAFVPTSRKIKYVRTRAVSRSELEAQPRADVFLKRRSLMGIAAELRARYYFQCDADDLVSNNLVRSVRQGGNSNGYLFESGYVLDSRTGSLYHTPNPQFPKLAFYEFCGSSIVLSLDPSPDEQAIQNNLRYLENILVPGHNLAKTSFAELGRTPRDLGFPGSIYRANHGSNLYLRLNRSARTALMDEIKFRCTPLSGVELQRVRSEFGLGD